jgi:hypothetical protein
MLYLAQVKQNSTSGTTEIQLLAYQQSDNTWGMSNSEILTINGKNHLSDRLLVLVELDENKQVLDIKEATDWVVGLVQQYLSSYSITPEFICQEQAKIEQWRQEIAAQNLDLTRRYLEVETQREQIQELEASLKQEREQLELRKQQIQALEANIEEEKNRRNSNN